MRYCKTYHEDTMEYGDYRVSFVKTISNIEKMRFVFEDTEIVCSTSHKFFVNNGWKEGIDMKVGGHMLTVELFTLLLKMHTTLQARLLSHNKDNPPPSIDGEGIPLEDHQIQRYQKTGILQ